MSERERSVPTLTEVVGEGEGPADAVPAAADPSPSQQQAFEVRVIAEVERRIDAALEARLRDSLAPVMARASDALIREMRSELEGTLREVVADAVAEALARERGTER